MRRLRDRVGEAGVGVRREIHRDRSTGGDAAGDLDVEGDLAVGIGAGLVVDGAIHRHRDDARRLQLHRRERGGGVAAAEAAAELDQPDGDAAAVDAGGEIVQRGQLVRLDAGRLGDARAHDARMRDRAAVQAEHGLDHPVQRVRHRERAAATVIGAAVLLVQRQPGAERSAQRLGRAGRPDQATGRIDRHHGEPVRGEEGLDVLDLMPVGGRALAGDGAATFIDAAAEFGAMPMVRPQIDAHLDALAGGHGAERAARRRVPMAAGDLGAFSAVCCGHGRFPCDGVEVPRKLRVTPATHATARAMSCSSTAPMQPIRNDGASVSLPG